MAIVQSNFKNFFEYFLSEQLCQKVNINVGTVVNNYIKVLEVNDQSILLLFLFFSR